MICPGIFVMFMPACAASHAERVAPEGVELATMNSFFREAYSAERARQTAEGPLIVVDFGRMLLLRDGVVVDEQPLSSPLFHTLKAFAHVPLGVYLLLVHHAEAPRTADVVEDIDRYSAALRLALTVLAEAPLSQEQQLRCRSICERALEILHAGQAGVPSRVQLEAFAVEVAPLMLANAAEAGGEWIRAMHAAVERWRVGLGADWGSIRVVVRGPHQARRLHAATQYFAAEFGTCGDGLSYPGESERIIFAEWQPSDSSDRDAYRQLVGTVEVDSEAAQLFFGDATALGTDVLAAGAHAELERLGLSPSIPCL